MHPFSYVIPDPLILMALPRSYGALAGAMLGQHPQMYGLPETHLFGCETMAEWCDRSANESFNMADGLVRVVAQLYFGAQDEMAVVQSKAWLRRRQDFTTGYLLETIAERVSPRILVDKSPSIVYSLASMQRAISMFPLAKIIHLVQHPRGFGESLMNSIRDAAENGPVPPWMLNLASFQPTPPTDGDPAQLYEDLDPQRAWHALNMNICTFLESISESRKLVVRWEDLAGDPSQELRRIADWVGVRSDAEAIEEMLHPERSPYACLGPPSARYGSDYGFLAQPLFVPASPESHTLDGVLGWRRDGTEFLPRVRELAQRFGYT
jgi:Sulfotransferase family